MIEGNTIIGEGCTIGPNSQLIDSVIGDRTIVHSSVVSTSKVGSDTMSARLRIFVQSQTLGIALKLETSLK